LKSRSGSLRWPLWRARRWTFYRKSLHEQRSGLHCHS
jgi:hypothetical protein